MARQPVSQLFLPRQRWTLVVEDDSAYVAGQTRFFPGGGAAPAGFFESDGYNRVIGTGITDSVGVLSIQFSWDELNIDWQEDMTVALSMSTTAFVAGSFRFAFPVPLKRMRITFTQDAGGAGNFRLGSYLVPV